MLSSPAAGPGKGGEEGEDRGWEVEAEDADEKDEFEEISSPVDEGEEDGGEEDEEEEDDNEVEKAMHFGGKDQGRLRWYMSELRSEEMPSRSGTGQDPVCFDATWRWKRLWFGHRNRGWVFLVTFAVLVAVVKKSSEATNDVHVKRTALLEKTMLTGSCLRWRQRLSMEWHLERFVRQSKRQSGHASC